MRAVNTYFNCDGQVASFAHGATTYLLGQRLEGDLSVVRADTRLQ